jgi:hypothetical protein
MQEDRVHIQPITRADYIAYIDCNESIKSSLASLHEPLRKVRETVTLLADLETTTDSSQEAEDSVTETPVVAFASAPAIPSVPEPTLPQPTLHAVKLSRREQLALA